MVSPWDNFRALCSYYINCVELGEKASEYVKYNGGKNRYKIVMPKRNWFTGEVFSLQETKEDLFLFSNIRMCNQQEERPYIGYPCQIIEGANSERLITPLFVIPLRLETGIRHNEIYLSADISSIKVNHRWIEYNIPRDEQKSFLNSLYNDKNETINFDIASSYLKNKYQMNFDSNTTNSYLDVDQEKIQNVAILTTGLRLKYSKTLRRELEMVRDQSDSVLDSTALAYVFRTPPLENKYQEDVLDFPIDFLDVPDAKGVRTAMNHQQRLALIDALSKPCSRIKGPPGTGKSHVAVNLLANLIFRGKTALFTSKNHKAIHAIDANVSKLLTHDANLHVVQYCSTEDQEGVRTSNAWFNLDPFVDIKEKLLKSTEIAPVTEKLYEDLMEELQEMSTYWKRYVDVKEKEEGLLKLAEELRLMSTLELPQDVSVEHVNGLIRILKKEKRSGLIGQLLDKLQQVEAKQVEAVKIVKDLYNLRRSTPQALAEKLKREVDYLQKKRIIAEEYDLRGAQVATTSDQNELLREIFSFQDSISRKRTKLFLYRLSQNVRTSTMTREKLMQHCRQLQDIMRTDFSLLKEKIQGEGHGAFKEFLKFYPVWVSTLLSLTKSSPCIPAVFDRVIIDEAAQCEVPPMIPALYRAKGVTIIGDDKQFPPVIDLSESVHNFIRRRHKIDDHFFATFDFMTANVYSIVSPPPKTPLVELTDHFRCENDIISYCNDEFYNGKLCTYTSPLKEESLYHKLGLERSLSWINTKDSLELEIVAAKDFLDKVAALPGKKPTIGVITPLNEVVEKLQKGLGGVINKINDTNVFAKHHISTVNSFQGGERDLVLIVFGYTSKLTRGQRWYLEEEKHKYIYNVAVSRAKKCCVLIGDQEKLKESSVLHLRQIASYPKAPTEITTQVGPGEKVLQEQLENLGLRPFPQYPLGTRVLDLALLDSKIDIEVDGFLYHTNCYGKRNMSDYDRDNQVRHAGFYPYRVWHHVLMNNPQKVALEIFELHKKRLEEILD